MANQPDPLRAEQRERQQRATEQWEVIFSTSTRAEMLVAVLHQEAFEWEPSPQRDLTLGAALEIRRLLGMQLGAISGWASACHDFNLADALAEARAYEKH